MYIIMNIPKTDCFTKKDKQKSKRTKKSWSDDGGIQTRRTMSSALDSLHSSAHPRQ